MCGCGPRASEHHAASRASYTQRSDTPLRGRGGLEREAARREERLFVGRSVGGSLVVSSGDMAVGYRQSGVLAIAQSVISEYNNHRGYIRHLKYSNAGGWARLGCGPSRAGRMQ